MNRFLRTLLLLLAGCVWGFTAQAQLSTATMFGTVTDSTGAAVPGATVTITQTDTQTSRTLKTGNDGAYRADFLPVGPYKVAVSAPGFKTLERTGITLTVTEEAHVDLQLSAGGESTTVEVTAEVPLLNTGNSTLGRTVSNVEIDNLPLVDRNVYTLLDLTPGVQNNNNSGAGGNGGVINPLGYPEQHVKINGSSDSGVGQVSYYLDGGSNMTGVRNTGNPLPNPDAIREFRVDTNNFSAQYGRNSAGVGHGPHQVRHQPVPRFGLRVLSHAQLQRHNPRHQHKDTLQSTPLRLHGRRTGRQGQALLLRLLRWIPFQYCEYLQPDRSQHGDGSGQLHCEHPYSCRFASSGQPEVHHCGAVVDVVLGLQPISAQGLGVV